jgi:hypothetical protein
MFAGRMIFGFGGETLNIANKVFTLKWCNKGEIALPIAITLCVERLANVVNDIISPILCSVILLFIFSLLI